MFSTLLDNVTDIISPFVQAVHWNFIKLKQSEWLYYYIEHKNT